MPKQYRIDYKISNRQAVSATRDLAKELEKLDQTARRAATSAQHAAGKIGAMNRASRAGAGGGYGGGYGGGAGGGTARSGGGPGGSGASLEDRYLLREYNGRVAHHARMQRAEESRLKREETRRIAHERRMEQIATTAAARAEANKQRTAAQLSAIEDRYAKRDYDQRVAIERRKEQETTRTAAKAQADKERGAARVSATEDAYLKREYDQRVTYERKQQLAIEQAGKRTAAAKQREAQQLAAMEERWLKREYDQRVAYERRKEVEAQRAAKRQVAIEERKQKELASLEDKWLRREQRERTASQRRKAEQATSAEESRVGSNQALMGHWATAAAAIGASIGHAVGATLKDLVHQRKEAATATTDMQKNLRVEAALMGRKNDATFLQQSLEFRARTGLDEAGASNFVRQFEGSLPVGIEKGNITRGVADELKLAAAQRARRLGGDEATHGDLAGILGQFTKINSAQEGLGKLEAIRYGLTKGRGDDTPLTQQFLKAGGTLIKEGGAVGSPEELAALIGVTSLKNPEEAATLAVQLNRAVRVGVHRQRKVKGAKDTQGNYLKKHGVTEKDSIESALDKVVPDLKKAEQQGRDLQGYLYEQGFGNEEERVALVNAYENYQPLKIRMAEMRAMGAKAGPEQMKANREDMESPEARIAVAKQLDAAATVTKGLPNQRWEAELAAARTSPEFKKEESSVLGKATDWLAGTYKGAIPGWDSVTERGSEYRASYHAMMNLRKKAKAAGVSDEDLTTAYQESQKAGWTDYSKFSDFANRIEGKINEMQGGSTAADIKPVLEELSSAIKEFNANERKKQPPARQAPAPLPGPPRGAPVRPGA